MRHSRIRRQRRRIDGKAMVLTGDQNVSGVGVEHWMISTMVAELHLDRPCAARKSKELVTEADPENRNPDTEKFTDRLNGISAGLGVTRSIGEKDSVRLERERLACARLCGHNGEFATPCGQHAEDVVLDAEIVSDDMKARLWRGLITLVQPPGTVRPVVGFGATHHLGEVQSHHRWCGSRA